EPGDGRLLVAEEQQVHTGADEQQRQQPAHHAAEAAPEDELEDEAEDGEQDEARVDGPQPLTLLSRVARERALQEASEAGAGDYQRPGVGPGFHVVGGLEEQQDEADRRDYGTRYGQARHLAAAHER